MGNFLTGIGTIATVIPFVHWMFGSLERYFVAVFALFAFGEWYVFNLYLPAEDIQFEMICLLWFLATFATALFLFGGWLLAKFIETT